MKVSFQADNNMLAPAATFHCNYCDKTGQRRGPVRRSPCSCAYMTTLQDTGKVQQASRRHKRAVKNSNCWLLIFQDEIPPESVGSIHSGLPFRTACRSNTWGSACCDKVCVLSVLIYLSVLSSCCIYTGQG